MKHFYKRLLIIILSLIVSPSFSQFVLIDYSNSSVPAEMKEALNIEATTERKIDFLNKGYVDYFTSGSAQASAEVIRVQIGEPNNSFKIPFYLFASASGETFGTDTINQNLIGNLLNPLGGIVNGSFSHQSSIFSTGEYTHLKLSSQLSGKLINGKDSLTDENVLIGSAYTNFGIFFQTGAWVNDDRENIGIFWFQAKVGASYLDSDNMRALFGPETNNISSFSGNFSIELGIEVNNKINFKTSFYKHFNNESIEGFSEPVFKIAFDHKFKQ